MTPLAAVPESEQMQRVSGRKRCTGQGHGDPDPAELPVVLSRQSVLVRGSPSVRSLAGGQSHLHG